MYQNRTEKCKRTENGHKTRDEYQDIANERDLRNEQKEVVMGGRRCVLWFENIVTTREEQN